jgi:hypothetical protein
MSFDPDRSADIFVEFKVYDLWLASSAGRLSRGTWVAVGLRSAGAILFW